MDLPVSLRSAIETLVQPYDTRALAAHVRSLTHMYTEESGSGKRLLTKDAEAAAYCAVRMPATFGAVSAALEWANECCDIRPRTLLDVGAGTGAASWAVNEQYLLHEVTCLEREEAMRKAGIALMRSGDATLQNAKWQNFDLASAEVLPKADMVIESYVVNEMTEDTRIKTVEKLWNACAQVLVLVEPGTPIASAQMSRIRDKLCSLGAYIAAPCPNSTTACPIPENDWCHFRCRVARSRLHKQLKGGDVPYEDEKFSYTVFTREPPVPAAARILRTPFVEKGRITLNVCDGSKISDLIVTKKDAHFKTARKADTGDAWLTE